MSVEENKKIIEKVNASFDEGDTETFLNYCAENIIWDMPGDQRFKGIQSLRDFMSKGPTEPPLFTIKDLIAEGNIVMCRGDMKMKNKEGVYEDYAFCDVYHFTNGLISELTSYIIKQKKA